MTLANCVLHLMRVILYADDILLISLSVTNPERMLHRCEHELAWLDMSINRKKSCCLRVAPRCNSVFNVRQSYWCARYWYRLYVCPSVCLFVTRWYCVESAQPIVKLSSLPGSPIILVFWGPKGQTFSRNSNGNTPTSALNARGRKKLQFPTNISL